MPFDSSEQSKLALEYAVENFPDDEFVLLHVVHRHPGHYLQPGKSGFSPSEEYEEEYEEAEKLLESVREELVPTDADVSTAIEFGILDERSSPIRTTTTSTTSFWGVTVGAGQHASYSAASPKPPPAGP